MSPMAKAHGQAEAGNGKGPNGSAVEGETLEQSFFPEIGNHLTIVPRTPMNNAKDKKRGIEPAKIFKNRKISKTVSKAELHEETMPTVVAVDSRGELRRTSLDAYYSKLI